MVIPLHESSDGSETVRAAGFGGDRLVDSPGAAGNDGGASSRSSRGPQKTREAHYAALKRWAVVCKPARSEPAREPSQSSAAFTLIEMILVMTLLTIAVSFTAPALANFFRGRSLDSEARRLLALTRAGQSRAVGEGIPMELWIDSSQRKYGLEAEPSYEQEDGKAVEFTLDQDLQIELQTPPMRVATSQFRRTVSQNVVVVQSRRPSLPKLRFLPDGTVAEGSPETIVLRHRDENSLTLTLSTNRFHYEIPLRNH